MNLQQAADQLGVHYQTVYRWVREGRLAASKVGATYEVHDADVERFLQGRFTPAPPPERIHVRRWDQLLERFLRLLREGQELEARLLVERLVNGQVATIDICENLIAPSLRSLGEQWHDGVLSIAWEHRGTAIVERTLSRMTAHPRGRPRGTVVVSTLPGDTHALPGMMAALVLRDDRWRVHHLGCDLPVEETVRAVYETSADLVVISVTYQRSSQLTELTRRLQATGAVLLVGHAGGSLTELVEQARRASASKRGSAP